MTYYPPLSWVCLSWEIDMLLNIRVVFEAKRYLKIITLWFHMQIKILEPICNYICFVTFNFLFEVSEEQLIWWTIKCHIFYVVHRSFLIFIWFKFNKHNILYVVITILVIFHRLAWSQISLFDCIHFQQIYNELFIPLKILSYFQIDHLIWVR